MPLSERPPECHQTGSTGGINRSTRGPGHGFFRGVTKSVEAALNLPDKGRGTMSLKSNGDRSEAERAEGEKRKQGQEVTWIQAKESLSFGLVTSKQWSLCVCVGRVNLTTSASSFPPSHSGCSLQASHSSFPQVTSLQLRKVEG